jgi:hypothetical protein
MQSFAVSLAVEDPTESSVRDVQMRFELDFCTSDAQYRLASKVGRGRGYRVSGERVFIEWEFAEIGQDSLSSEKLLANQTLRKKTRSARQIAGKQGWGISEIFLRKTPHVKEWSFSAGL